MASVVAWEQIKCIGLQAISNAACVVLRCQPLFDCACAVRQSQEETDRSMAELLHRQLNGETPVSDPIIYLKQMYSVCVYI